MKTLYGIAIFPIAFFIISCELPIVNSCPEKCLCGSNAVHCASKNLRRFPSNLPPRTQQLLLQNNTISKVPLDFLRTNNGVHTVLLNNNRIKVLVPAASTVRKSLHYLDLGNNLLRRISRKALSQLGALRFLNFSHNKISTLPANIFVGLTTLRELYLSYNELQILPTEIFRPLTNLTCLALDHNHLHRIRDRTFDSLVVLHQLDLSYNRLWRITSGATKGLAVLQRLDLRGNVIRSLDPQFSRSSEACLQQTIFTYKNRQRGFSKGFLNNLKELQELDVSNNSLSTLRYVSFSPLKKLRHVLMDNNHWSCDCHLKRALEEIQKHRSLKVFAITGLRCWRPQQLRGVLINDISVQDLADLQQPTAMPTSQTTHSSSLAVLPMQKQAIPSLAYGRKNKGSPKRADSVVKSPNRIKKGMSNRGQSRTKLRSQKNDTVSKIDADNFTTACATAGLNLPQLSDQATRRSQPKVRLPDLGPSTSFTGTKSPLTNVMHDALVSPDQLRSNYSGKHPTLEGTPHVKTPVTQHSAMRQRHENNDQQPFTINRGQMNANESNIKQSAEHDEVISWLLVAAIFIGVFAIAICGAVALNKQIRTNGSKCGCCKTTDESPSRCASESVRSVSNYPLLYDNPLARRPLPRQPMPTSREFRPGGAIRAGSGLDIRWTCGGTFGIGEPAPCIPPKHPSIVPRRFVSRMSSSCPAPTVPPRDPISDRNFNDVTDDATDSVCSDQTSVSTGGGSIRSAGFRARTANRQRSSGFRPDARSCSPNDTSPRGEMRREESKRRQEGHQQRQLCAEGKRTRPGSAAIEADCRSNRGERHTRRHTRSREGYVSAPFSRQNSDASTSSSCSAARRAKRERDVRHALEVLQEIETARRNSNAGDRNRRQDSDDRPSRTGNFARLVPEVFVSDCSFAENYVLGSVAPRKARKSASARRSNERPVRARGAYGQARESTEEDNTRRGATRSKSLVVKQYVGDIDFEFPPPPPCAHLGYCEGSPAADTPSLSEASFDFELPPPPDCDVDLEEQSAYDDDDVADQVSLDDVEDNYSQLALYSSGDVPSQAPKREKLEDRLKSRAQGTCDHFPRGRNDSTDSMFATRNSNCDSLSTSDLDESCEPVVLTEMDLTSRFGRSAVKYRTCNRFDLSETQTTVPHRASVPALNPNELFEMDWTNVVSLASYLTSDDIASNNSNRYLSKPGDPFSVNINRRSRLDMSLSDSEWEKSMPRAKSTQNLTRPTRSSSATSCETITQRDQFETESKHKERAEGLNETMGRTPGVTPSSHASSVEHLASGNQWEGTYQALHHMYSGKMPKVVPLKDKERPACFHAADEPNDSFVAIDKSDLKCYYVDAVESSADDVSTDIELLDLGTS